MHLNFVSILLKIASLLVVVSAEGIEVPLKKVERPLMAPKV
jgi:hypothetical protein